MLRLTFAFVLMSASAAAETFTLNCHPGAYYVTFDTDTKRMAAESIERTVYRGKIMSVSEDVIVFHLLPGEDYHAEENRPLSYLRKEGRLVATTRDENSLYQCVPMATRGILSKWDQLN